MSHQAHQLRPERSCEATQTHDSGSLCDSSGLTFLNPKVMVMRHWILEVSKSIKSRGFCLLHLEKNMLGYIIVIDPTQIWGPHNAFFKSLASALPEGQAKLRWSGIPNGYLSGLLKLHLYLSRTGTWICGPCSTQHCYPKLSTLIWNVTNRLEIGIHKTSVSLCVVHTWWIGDVFHVCDVRKTAW